jgi:hypothetical protein
MKTLQTDGDQVSRRARHRRLATVEDCYRLRARDLLELGLLRDDTLVHATLSWKGGPQGVITGSVRDGFSLWCWTEGRMGVKDTLQVVTTRPWFGGLRYWIRCHCGSRTTGVYLAPGTALFRCRLCHRLTYRSSRRSHSRVSFYRRNPQAAEDYLARGVYAVRELFYILRAAGSA